MLIRIYIHTHVHTRKQHVSDRKGYLQPSSSIYTTQSMPVFIWMYTHVRTHIHSIQQHTYTHLIEKDTCCPCRQPLHRSLCRFSYTCIYMYAHTFTCISMYAHIFTCIYMYAHTFTCIYMYAHTFTRIYMYAHTFIRNTATHLHPSDRKEYLHHSSSLSTSLFYACTADCR